MERSFEEKKYLYKIYFSIGILFIGLILGVLSILYPVLTLALILILILIFYLIKKTERIFLFILILSSISMNGVIKFNILGLDANSIYKLTIILIMLLALKYFRVNLSNSLPILALFLMLIFSYTFSDLHPAMSELGPFVALLGLSAPFFILIVKWSNKMANKIIFCIILLPLISVFVGLVLSLLGIHSFIIEEISGAIRLRGANIGAHLAMLAFLGFSISLVELKRNLEKKSTFFLFMCINFFILLSTGTRGPLIASVLLLLLYLVDNIKEYIKGKVIVIIPLLTFLFVIITLLYTQWNNIKTRTFNANSSSSGINFSGREEAWAFFLSGTKGYEIFGRGLGAVLVANDGTLFKGFVVPHNEYIRFFYDSGFIGVILIFGSLAYILITLAKCMPKFRLYYITFILSFFIYSFVDNTITTPQFIIPFCFYISALSSIYMKKGDEINTVK